MGKISLIILKGCDTKIFNIHESGKIAIDKMFEKSNSKDKSFRIYIRRISAWLGPVFDVVLDEPSNKDEIFEADGYKIIIHKELAEKINSVEIFFKEGISKSGFRVLTDIVWKFEYRFMDWAKIKYVYENKLQNK